MRDWGWSKTRVNNLIYRKTVGSSKDRTDVVS